MGLTIPDSTNNCNNQINHYYYTNSAAGTMTLPGADEVQLRARYFGTGNADTTTKHVFMTNQHRDTAASIISHSASQCAYYAVAQNESIYRTRYNLLESMIQPCGLPPHLQQATNGSSNNTNGMNSLQQQQQRPSSTTP